MPRTRDPFKRALNQLRRRVENGVIRPGAMIMIADEARRLRLSTTPVREALARLLGEGLIVEAPSGGFMRPSLGATSIRDQYELHEIYATAALAIVVSAHSDGTTVRSLPWRNGTGEPGQYPAESFFDRLVRRADNKALEKAQANLSLQLRAVRSIEKLVLDNLVEEAEQLHQLASDNRWAELRQGISTYHLRRREAAGMLALAIRSMSPERSEAGGAP